MTTSLFYRFSKFTEASLLCHTLDMKIMLINSTSRARAKMMSLLAVDVSISLFLYVLLVPNFHTSVDEFWRQTAILADNLNGTVTWLRSNPAGLKLNTPVNETLAWFYSYHIYLWTTFIGYLRSEYMFRFAAHCLLGGVSTFCSLVFDFSQIFFLHFNCFDAYATKLCHLCYYTLTALWGLVRGKKWNPLRKRIDNVALDTRQQFLATSLFVILLFILPTTLVYFLVFRTLRLFVSLVQEVLRQLSLWPFQVYYWRENLKLWRGEPLSVDEKKKLI